MTLVIAMKSADGIVLAADSRGTIGDPRGLTAINDTQIKIHSLGNCGLAFAGAAEMGSVLLDELRQRNLASFTEIDSAVRALVTAMGNSFNTWFGAIPAAQRPAVLVTLAGYRLTDAAAPEPMIYLLQSQTNFAPQLFRDHCMAGVPQYAVYLIHRYYDATIPLDKAKALAEYLIAETASQDPKVGGPIQMAVIRPSEPYRQLSDVEVNEVHKANEDLNKRLREFFLSTAAPVARPAPVEEVGDDNSPRNC